MVRRRRIKRIFAILILSSLPTVAGPLIQHCIIPEPIILRLWRMSEAKFSLLLCRCKFKLSKSMVIEFEYHKELETVNYWNTWPKVESIDDGNSVKVN